MARVDESGSLELIRGDDIRIPLQFLQNDGVTPIDLTGCTLKSEIRTKIDGYVALALDVVYLNLENGEVVLVAPHEKTRGIRIDEGVWDIEMTWATGLIETILPPAPVQIIKDVTKS